ncbi:hypothetical protein ACFXPX_05090 [Kitasatospora sp. NPDC059146]|uniref:hypothetical protein n=1 Tax=unclassified Kitasatospora TaxID=2633591 RepID=UPI0036C014B5
MTSGRSTPHGEEEIVVGPEHVLAVLRSVDRMGLFDQSADAEVSGAIAELTAASLTQPRDAEVWRLPARAACFVALWTDAAGLLDLDEGDRDTYVHPAIVAEEEFRRAVVEQAPRTLGAFQTLLEAHQIMMSTYVRGHLGLVDGDDLPE